VRLRTQLAVQLATCGLPDCCNMHSRSELLPESSNGSNYQAL
jgi:hypothetical protein